MPIGKLLNVEDKMSDNLEAVAGKALKLYRRKANSDAFRNISLVLITACATGVALYRSGFIKPELPEDSIALIEYHGAVSSSNDATNAMKVSGLIDRLSEDSSTKAILLSLNSNGGSPVQAEALYKAINSIKEKPDSPRIYGSIGEVCASACMYVASALDEVYAHDNSIVGSIGVRMDSWGVNELMQRHGIERRTITVGDNKNLFDPFSERDKEGEAHLEAELLEPVYEDFVNAVKNGRSNTIKESDEIYSGLVWTGSRATDFGLIDGVSTQWETHEMLKEKYDVSRVSTYQTSKRGIRVHIESALHNALDKIVTETLSDDSIRF